MFLRIRALGGNCNAIQFEAKLLKVYPPHLKITMFLPKPNEIYSGLKSESSPASLVKSEAKIRKGIRLIRRV